MSFDSLFETEKALESFIEHVAKEFSSENLFSIYEFSCFKKLLFREHSEIINKQRGNKELDKKYLWNFPDFLRFHKYFFPLKNLKILQFTKYDTVSVAPSSIVDDKTVSLKQKAIQLIEKYIFVDSEYEVNISSRTAKSFKCHAFCIKRARK